jgi:ribosome-associated translation inhibitor RaiA
MKLIIKARNFKPTLAFRKMIESKFKHIDYFVNKTAVLEVALLDDFGPQGGNDKVVEINLADIYKNKKLIRIEERADFWDKAIDFAKERLERILEDRKEKEKAPYKRKKQKFSRTKI